MCGRFRDSWVVDRVMFEYVNQGGCSCCGMSHIGMDLNTFMQMCSDVETDDGKKERTSPWPPFILNEVWGERVKFRKALKSTMPVYRAFWDAHGDEFSDWYLGTLDPKDKRHYPAGPSLAFLNLLLNVGRYDGWLPE